jgi:hypothetical protein
MLRAVITPALAALLLLPVTVLPAPGAWSAATVTVSTPGAGAGHAEPRTRGRGKLRVSPAWAGPGDPVTITGTFRKARRAKVLVKLKVGGSRAQTIAKVRASKAGRFALSYRLPTFAPGAAPDSLAFSAKVKGKVHGTRYRPTRKVEVPRSFTAPENYTLPFGWAFMDPTLYYGMPVNWSASRLDLWYPQLGQRTFDIASVAPYPVSSTRWTTSGTFDAPVVVADAVVDVPPVGVTPGRQERHLYIVDARTRAVTRDILVGPKGSGFPWVFGSTTGGTAVIEHDDAGTTVVRSYDVGTGQVRWSLNNVRLLGGTFETVVVEYPPGPSGCGRAGVLDSVTGAVLATLDGSAYDVEECDLVTLGGSRARVDGAAFGQRYYQITFGYPSTSVFLDARTGAPATLPEGSAAVDPRSSLVFGDYHSQVVMDTRTGAVVYTVPPALQAKVLALNNGRLYLKTAGGTPVYDVIGGRLLTNNSRVYPEATLPGEWTRWSDNKTWNWPFAVVPPH